MTWPTLTALRQIPILVFTKLVALDKFSPCGEKNTEWWQGWTKRFLIKAKLLHVKYSSCYSFVIYAWTRHRFESQFFGRERCQFLIQLDHVVFWSIVNAFVTIVNVRWPLPKYFQLLVSVIKCKMLNDIETNVYP